MTENWQVAGFGLYVHWPFCQSKCPYCDFNSHVSAQIDHQAWTAAYLREIDRLGRETSERRLTSIFFGGGTPSLMQADTVAAIIDESARHWTFANDIEITLEANPTSVERERFSDYHIAGVGRVSLGVQALDDTALARLGRLHSANEALAALEVARTTFERVSFDLIYARQDQSLADWEEELKRALSFDPDHLSLYQLTIEPGTAFGDRFARGRLPGLPDEDLGADLYDATQVLTEGAGLPAYEVSNHAKAGEASRHNLIYWQAGDWAGIGPGAHGRLSFGQTRYATETPKAPGLWLEQATKGKAAETRTLLARQDADIEYLMMGLRILTGVDQTRLSTVLRSKIENKIKYLCEIGLVEESDEHLRLTPKCRPLLNAVIRELLPD